MATDDAAAAPEGLVMCPGWIWDKEMLGKLHTHFREEVPYEQAHLKMYGKTIPTPRLVSCMADPGVDTTLVPEHTLFVPFTEPARKLKEVLEARTGRTFPYAEINLYRDSATGHKDHIGLHRDKECGPGQLVACVTLGGVRKLRFVRWPLRAERDKARKPFDVEVGGGDLYIMDQATCHTGFKHSVVRTVRPVQARIAITFRELPVRTKRT